MSIALTYYGANGWLVEIGGLKVLIDPWLKGDLTFPPGDWLIKGELEKLFDYPKNIGLILLTQGLSDHSHIPTLEGFSKDIPIIGSKNACNVCKIIGFKSIQEINPGELKEFNTLKIKATKGAEIPNVENGYIIKSKSESLYIEPHGFLDKTIKKEKIDIIITPIFDIGIPIIGNFIKGSEVLPKIIERFCPSYIYASTTGGDIKFTGLLGGLISQRGSIEKIKEIIPSSIKLIDPSPGFRYI